MTYVEKLAAMRARPSSQPREYITNAEYARLKLNLTSAKNSGDGRRILATVEKAIEVFDAKVWPDDWTMWRIALEDAAAKARYQDGDHALAAELNAAAIILFP